MKWEEMTTQELQLRLMGLWSLLRSGQITSEEREQAQKYVGEINAILVPRLESERKARGEPNPENLSVALKPARMLGKSPGFGSQSQQESTIGESEIVYTTDDPEDVILNVDLGGTGG